MEMGIKSKEARKYIFNCLDDMMQVHAGLSRSTTRFPHSSPCQNLLPVGVFGSCSHAALVLQKTVNLFGLKLRVESYAVPEFTSSNSD